MLKNRWCKFWKQVWLRENINNSDYYFWHKVMVTYSSTRFSSNVASLGMTCNIKFTRWQTRNLTALPWAEWCWWWKWWEKKVKFQFVMKIIRLSNWCSQTIGNYSTFKYNITSVFVINCLVGVGRKPMQYHPVAIVNNN